MSSVLARIEVRMPAEFKDHLTTLAKERGVSLSEMAVSALQAMVEQPGTSGVDIQVLELRLRHLEEALMTFIKVFFSLVPEVPASEREAAAVRGRERWQRFQDLVYSEERR